MTEPTTFDIFEFQSIDQIELPEYSQGYDLEIEQWKPRNRYQDNCRYLLAEHKADSQLTKKKRKGKFVQLILKDYPDSKMLLAPIGAPLELSKKLSNNLSSEELLEVLTENTNKQLKQQILGQPLCHEMLIFLAYDSGEAWYHAAIVREFIRRTEIAGGYPDKYKHLGNFENCFVNTDFVNVIGGGEFLVDLQGGESFLTLKGKSMAYGGFKGDDLIQKMKHRVWEPSNIFIKKNQTRQ